LKESNSIITGIPIEQKHPFNRQTNYILRREIKADATFVTAFIIMDLTISGFNVEMAIRIANFTM
jgi:hypothetical protein